MNNNSDTKGYFWNSIDSYGSSIALVSESYEMTYEQLDIEAKEIAKPIPTNSFVFLICRNSPASIAGYIGFLQKRIVPVLLNASIDKKLFFELVEHYLPQFIWCPEDFIQDNCLHKFQDYILVKTAGRSIKMDSDLAVLLTTSGSTGSPKFVRQTHQNIQTNTASIVDYLSINSKDRAITTMPMSYTYGLSIIQSHLMAGAKIITTEKTFFDRDFWNFFREKEASTFGAVPYTYQMLNRLGFLRMDLPSLRYITQAGGRLGEELHYKFANGMKEKGKALIVMYGATEATARMSYVPSEFSVLKAGSIGIPIPGGRFELIEMDGSVINQPDCIGELVYYGENVTPGYADSRDDLSKGDERYGRLETGDMAFRDEDEFYYIVGRKKRFLKIYGNRVNLVEIEELLNKAGYRAACVGEDDHMRIYTTHINTEEVISFISQKTGLNRSAFRAIFIEAIPYNDAGKILYSELE